VIAVHRRLQRRLMLAFGSFALFVALLFAGHAALFMYALEDQFFEVQLQEEAKLQAAHFAATGRWTEPFRSHVQRHDDPSTFPDDLRDEALQHPRRREFAGSAGRHYHLHRIELPGGEVSWLVTEASEHLMLRPMRGTFVQVLAWLGVFVVGAALLTGAMLARRTTAPLVRLAELVSTMQPGQLPQSLPGPFSNDEVGVLARGLEGLIQRVSDFIAREQEFTRDASHELRTPLAVIRSAGEQLAATPGLDGAAHAHLTHIRHSAAQLEQTVATLLSLAREGLDPGVATSVRVLPLLERVIVEQAPLLAGRQVELDLQVPAGAQFPLPAPILHILLSNLVGNAFAHTDGDVVRVVLDDTALRITNRCLAEHAPRVDQTFARREGSAGFGLGLGIVRRLCERHGIALVFETHDDEVTAVLMMPAHVPREPSTRLQ
jgi:signal transduction histidine kinase